VVKEIKTCHEKGQPVLSERSRSIVPKNSTMLKRTGIKHVILNAKYHEKGGNQPQAAAAPDHCDQYGRPRTDVLLGESRFSRAM
jgi:preprotein translocase subunit SecA